MRTFRAFQKISFRNIFLLLIKAISPLNLLCELIAKEFLKQIFVVIKNSRVQFS